MRTSRQLFEGRWYDYEQGLTQHPAAAPPKKSKTHVSLASTRQQTIYTYGHRTAAHPGQFTCRSPDFNLQGSYTCRPRVAAPLLQAMLPHHTRSCTQMPSPLLRQQPISQDSLWQRHIHDWLAAQDAGHLDVEAVRRALGVPSYRRLHHQLRALGAWPVGVWRRIDGKTAWQRKTGGMLVVTLQHGVFVAYAHTSQGHVSRTPLWTATLSHGSLRMCSAQGVVTLQVDKTTNTVTLIQRCELRVCHGAA